MHGFICRNLLAVTRMNFFGNGYTPETRNKRSKPSDRTPHSNSKKTKAEVCPICDV